LRHVGVKSARTERVDPHAVRRELDRCDIGELHQARFRHTVGCSARGRQNRSHRGHIDDGAGSTLDHVRRHGLDREQGGFQIDGHEPIEFFLRHTQQRGAAKDARIVDEDVDMTEFLHGGGRHPFNVAPLTDIDVNEWLTQSSGGLLQHGSIDIREQHPRPFFDKAAGYREPNAAGGPGHDGRFSFQTVHFELSGGYA
jgi:hypothetical protein